MEKKTFEFKGSVGDAGTIEGYGAVTGNIDSYNDVIVPGAFKNLSEFVDKGSLLVGHDWGSFGVGTIDSAQEQPNGLFFKATFHSDDAAQVVRNRVTERMSRGKFVGLSIGYQTLESETGQKDGENVRYIKALNVFEISLVTVPANPQAGVTSAKSFEDRTDGAFAALDEILAEFGRIKTLRLKDGRNFPSDYNRSRIEAFAAKCAELQDHFADLLKKEPEMATPEQIHEVHTAMARVLAAPFLK